MKMQKVIWYEGMKLDPHHFQQSDRFNQFVLNSRLNALNSHNWGIKEILIDHSALAGGVFSLVSCEGVMPDGLYFNMPNTDPLPKGRNFEELFSATSERLEISLAIPLENLSGTNCSMSDSITGSNNRFTIQNADLLDYNTGSNLRSVGLAKANFQFRFGNESLADFSSIKIGDIIRSSDGKYTLDQSYILPCTSISASEALLNLIRDLLSALISKSKELREQAAVKKPELSITQVEILMMLQSINSVIPILNYYYTSKHIHPENLYILLLNTAGLLSTHSDLGIKSGEFPAYDHKHLTEIFMQLQNEIKTMLTVQKTLERKDVIIPLRKQADTLHVGQLSPNHLSAQFFIAVTGDMPEKKIISELPKNIKIAAYEEIFAVHQAGIQGVTIEYIARPPSGISINEKAHYFKIIKEGRFWDKISAKNNVAFFIASEFKSLKLELVLLS